MADAVCPTCGASTKEHRHSLSRRLIEGLEALDAAGGGPLALRLLGLDRSRWDNFQKMKHFGLVEQVYVGGRRQLGVWKVTDFGRQFLAGTVSVRKVVVTFRDKPIRFDGPTVSVQDLRGGFSDRETWAADATDVHLHTSEAP